MIIITPTTALLVFAVIIVIACSAASLIKPGEYDTSRWKVFIITLAGFGVLLTLMFYYAVIGIQLTQNELLFIRETQNVELAVQEVSKKISEGIKIDPLFTKTLIPLQHIPTEDRSTKTKKSSFRYDISSVIFGTWQVSMLEKKYIQQQDTYYLRQFLQWANSKKLKKYWNNARISLVPDTQALGNILFKYSRKIKDQTPKAYVEMANYVKNLPCYMRLFRY